MQFRSLLFTTVVFVAGCGGGGGGGGGDAATTQSISGTSTSTPSSASSVSTLCGVSVGPSLLSGTVTNVHDGDTITVTQGATTEQVRLDSIDAPELAQPYGPESQRALSALLSGQDVRVAWLKRDKYNRIVGAVFTTGCEYANLKQVASGMAWFYKAYQCEIAATTRTQFAAAQDAAVQAKFGLWAQADPEAPWFYRNGSEPVTPTCTSDQPVFASTYAMPDVTATAPANTSTSISPTSSTTTNATSGTSTNTNTTSTTGSTSSKISYVGPRGGTYTLTANGNKNYSGC